MSSPLGLRAPKSAPTVASPMLCAVPKLTEPCAGVTDDRDGAGRTSWIVPAEEVAGCTVPPADRSIEVELGNRKRRGLDEGRKALFVAPERLVQDRTFEGDRGHPSE